MTFAPLILFVCFSSTAFDGSFARQLDSALVGAAYCADGQVAWCRNLSAAADCNAFQHCLQTVWLTQKPPIVGSCGLCETEIPKLRRRIGSNTTAPVIEELLSNVCGLNFATELFRRRCERYVHRYVASYMAELLDLLESDPSPATVCQVLGFCSTADTSSGLEDAWSRNVLRNVPVDSATSYQLYGASKCTWGPSYWCQNLTSSAECRSTAHCIRSVWSTQRYPRDDDSVCKVCKDMVQQARDQLQSNETQQELRQVLEGSCRLIPIKAVSDECAKLADDFEVELTEMLVSEMNPTVVCTVAGLCNSQRIDRLLEAYAEPAQSCANCTIALAAVERYLERASRSEVLDKLTSLCGRFSTYTTFCLDVVTSNFDFVYEVLTAELRPFPGCYLAAMCTADDFDSAPQANVTALADDLPCDLCKQLVKHLKDMLTTNTTEGEFLAILHGICEHTKSFKEKCLEIVDENFQKIYKFLTEELSPEEVCAEVNLCPKKKVASDETLHLIDHEPLVPAVITSLSLATPVENSECQFCALLVDLLQKEMKKPEYRHDIKKLLGRICSLVPRLERNKCGRFIQKHGDALIKLLTEHTSPRTICKVLGQCLFAPAVGTDLCPLCKDVMHYLEVHMQSSGEQQKVEQVLRKICRIAPASERQKCQSFVDEYTALILDLLSVELDPSLACPAMKLCPQNLTQLESCNQCQRLMGSMTKSLGRNRSQRRITSALDSLVPAKNSDSYFTALQLKIRYGNDIADMMVAEFDAQESCVFLRFCEPDMISAQGAVAQAPEETNDIAEATAPLTKPSCELCELMVQLYVDKLTSNASEAEIEADLQKYCAKIKNPEFRSNCVHFVQKYVPQVVQLLKKDVTPQEVCSLVKLCPPKFDLTDVAQNNRCEFCEAVVGSLEALSADPRTMTKSIRYLLAICQVFQKLEERANCMKIIAYVGPQLEGVALGIPSWFYCSKMRMCPYGAHLSYKRICHDQSQWCAGATNAMLCDQLSYCQESVWMADKPSP